MTNLDSPYSVHDKYRIIPNLKVLEVHVYENARGYKDGILVVEGSSLQTRQAHIPRDQPIAVFKAADQGWLFLVTGEFLDHFLGILLTAKALNYEISVSVIEAGGDWVGKCVGIAID